MKFGINTTKVLYDDCKCFVLFSQQALVIISVSLPVASHLTLNLPAHLQPGGLSPIDTPALEPEFSSVCLPACIKGLFVGRLPLPLGLVCLACLPACS